MISYAEKSHVIHVPSTLKGSEAYFPHLMTFFSKECNVENGREEKSNFTAETPNKHYLKNKDKG